MGEPAQVHWAGRSDALAAPVAAPVNAAAVRA